METDRKMYDRQKQFFIDAYRTGKIGWPREEASRLVELLLEASSLSKGGRVLEIGSGEGRNLRPFLDRGWQVVGVDLVFDPLQKIQRESLGRKGSRPALVQGDLFRLPFQDGIFDIVFDFGVFHHLRRPERRAYPHWISRLLKPGGLVGLGVFSEKFRHHDDEVRLRGYLTHRGHYDAFFREEELPALLGKSFSLLTAKPESTGLLEHYFVSVYCRTDGQP